MKRTFVLVPLLVALVLGNSALAVPFGPTNIVVLRVGDGASALTNVGNAVFLDEYYTNGILRQSVMLPTNYFGANSPLLLSGPAVAQGKITTSTDGRFIVLAGYGATLGQFTSTSLPNTSPTQAPRVVGLVDGSGRAFTTTMQTNSTTDANDSDIRAAASTEGTNLWFCGDTTSLKYTTRGSSLATRLSTQISNLRTVHIFSNQLYFSDASGVDFRVATAGPGLPTIAGQVFTNLPGYDNSAGLPFDFVLFKLNTVGANPFDTLYVADDAGINGAVYKWSLVGGTWVSNGYITAFAPQGVAGRLEISGTSTNVRLWITGGGSLTGGHLSQYYDTTGYNGNPGGPAADFLVAPGTNQAFRGIALPPVGTEPFPVGPGQLSVGPILGFFTSGLTGCSVLSTQTYSLANFGTVTISWSASVDSNWVSLSESSGTLASGGSVTVSAFFNGNVTSLATATNTALITFSNTTSAPDNLGTTTRPVRLILRDQTISPATGYTASGDVGGPFTPSNKVYTVSNGSTPITLIATNGLAGLTVTPPSVSLGACASTTITVSVNQGVASGLVRGNYSDNIVFSNATAGTLIDARPGQLLVGFDFFRDDFGTFNTGDLVGQQGWQQVAGISTLPLQVTNGVVLITGDQTGDNQDAFKNFPFVTNKTVFLGFTLNVNNAPFAVNPSFIVALNTTNNVGGFNNYRISATSSNATGGTYRLAARTTGQPQAPFSYSTNTLTYGTTYRVVVQTDPAGSNTTVYINPTSANIGAQIASLVSTSGSGVGPAVTLGSALISQFQSATAPICDVAIGRVCTSTNYADVYTFLTQTNSWTDGNGKWETGSNWSLGTAPATSDLVNLITNAGNNTVTIDATSAGNFPATMTVSNLTVSAPVNNTNTLFLNDAGTNTPLRILNAATISTGGALVVTNSALSVDGIGGGDFRVDGSVSLTDGSSTIVSNISTVIGNIGSGSLTVSGGSMLVSLLRVGNTAGSLGTVTASGGTITSVANFDGIELGNAANSTGTFWLTGGQLVVTNNAGTVIGKAGAGQMSVSNGTALLSAAYVGFNAGSAGTLTIAGGTSQFSSLLYLGRLSGATGAVWLTGGQLVLTNAELGVGQDGVGRLTVSNGLGLLREVYVGYTAGSRGTLTIAGGTTVLSSDLTIGRSASATGTVAVTAGSLFVTNGAGTATLVAGQSGRGIYMQTGGTVTVDQLVVTNHPTDALLQLQGGTLFTRATVYSNVLLNVGTAGNSATLNFQGATHSLLGSLILGPSANSTGAVWMTASQLTVGSADIGLNGAGQMTVSNGTWQSAGSVRAGVFGGSRGTLTIAGGTSSVFSNLIIGNFPCAPTGTVVVAGGNLFVTNSTASAVLDVRTRSLTLNSGQLTVDSLVITNACGSLTLSNGTLNTSSTVVNNGSIVNVGGGVSVATLHLSGGVHSFANNLRIRNNATLSGCGTVTGNVLVDVGGTVVADCGGVLNFSGIVTNNGSIVAVNGTVLNFLGPVVNNGSIVATNGVVEFYGGVVNNGTIIPNSWTDGNGKWETASNWSAGSAPSTNDPADFITKAGNNTVAIDATTVLSNAINSCMTINNLLLSAPVGSSNTLSLSAAGTNTPLRVLSHLTLDGRGILVVSNSALRVDGDLAIGSNGSSNRLILAAGSRLDSITGTIGSNSTANANTVLVTGTNSLWKTTNLVVGVAGSDNVLSISNAARLSVSGTFTVGSGPSISGNRIETVDGGILEVVQTVSVGGTNSGQATFQVTGGDVILSSNFIAGSSVDSVAIVTVTDGGQLVVTNGVMGIGNDGALTNGTGTGLLTISNGTLIALNILLGSSVGGEGLLTVLPGGVVTAPLGCTNCGITANGIVLAGGTIIMPDLSIGESHPGEMIISNGIAIFTNAVVGVDNTGTLTMLDGSMTLLSNLFISANSIATGTVRMTGGTLTVTNGVFAVGNAGTDGSTGGVAHATVSDGLVDAASILVGDVTGGDSGLTVDGNGYVRTRGGFRSNGIKTTTVNGGTLEVLYSATPPPFEDPVLHNRIVVSHLADGKLVVSNGTVKAPEMLVGATAGRTGTLGVHGGSVNLSSNLLVGISSTATGVVTITGGSVAITNGVFAVGNGGTATSTGGVAYAAVSNGLVDAASILVGDATGGDSGLTVAGSGHVRARGGFRSNGIKTTTVNGGTLEVLAGPPPSFEDPILHERIVVAYLADGKLVVSNGTVRTPGMVVGASANKIGTLNLAGGTTSVFSNLTVGLVACTATGIANVSGGSLLVTNAAVSAVLEVRSGTLTQSGGLVQVDKLVVTNACARLVRTGGTLLYNQLVLDPTASAVGDGIPNGWKQQYGLDPFDPAVANTDSDGDGFTNLQEYQAGFNPTNGVASLQIVNVTRTGNDIKVTYLGANGDSTYAGGPVSRTNVLEVAIGTATGGYTNNFVGLVTNVLGGGTGLGVGTNMVDSGAATNAPARYYRVRVLP